jgi:hypothetical protein
MGWVVSTLNLLFAVFGAALLFVAHQGPTPAVGAGVILLAGVATLTSIWSGASRLRVLVGLAAIILHLCVTYLGVTLLLEGISEHRQGDIGGTCSAWLSPGLFLTVPLLSMVFVALTFIRERRSGRSVRSPS